MQPIKWETGMPMYNSTMTTELDRFGLGKNHIELAQFILWKFGEFMPGQYGTDL